MKLFINITIGILVFDVLFTLAMIRAAYKK